MLKNKKEGFTLTEVIIVIAIMAALALILIPNMLNMMPDDHNIKYKKAFFTIQEVVNDIATECQGATFDKDSNPQWTPVESDNVLNYCYKLTTVEGGAGTTYSARNLGEEICNRMNVTTEDCTGNPKDLTSTNGMHWWLPNTSLNTDFNSNETIYVSVEGIPLTNEDGKSNVTGTSKDKGIYKIIVSKTGKVSAPSGPEQEYLLKNPTED